MTDHAAGNPYSIYWKTWILLLIVTVAMLGAEALHMPRWFLVLFLLAFMMIKASMIGLNFMHLKFERSSLVFVVAGGILLTSLTLYLFITPESHYVRDKTTYPAANPVPAKGEAEK